MKKLAVAALVSLASLGFLTPRASAWCCKGCYSCYKLCYIQPNAFSPFCPEVRPCCCGCCPKFCCPTCYAPPTPCCKPCLPPCCAAPSPCMDGSCGGPVIAPAAPSSKPSSAPGSIPSTMPPASNGNYTAPMPMPTTQAHPYAPPMMGYPNYPMVQPVGYPPSYGPMMMNMPYGGYAGTVYGPAPKYWNPNYRGY